MTINELRIGNIVKMVTQCGIYDIVSEIGIYNEHPYVRCKDTHTGWYLHHKGKELVKGVPLSENWLIRFGFEKKFCDDESYYYSLNFKNEKYCDLGLMSSDLKTVTLFPYDNFFQYKYVHQLQNVYLSITGKELEITNYEPTI